jgi:hypothetical protein
MNHIEPPLLQRKYFFSKFQKIKIYVSYLTDLFHIFVTIESAAEAAACIPAAAVRYSFSLATHRFTFWSVSNGYSTALCRNHE